VPPPPRYARHERLRGIGPEGMRRIRRSRVLVTGVGALGCTIASLLARSGVAFLRLADKDSPELHNLHRQTLFDEEDVRLALPKPQAAARKLRAANSDVTVDAVTVEIGPDNIHDLLEGMDLVVDALDNMETRYVVNDAIIQERIPYIFGGAVETSGNVMTIIPGETPCLRCLWPDPRAVAAHAKAADVGVLSSTASTVASIQAAEAFKLLAGRAEERLRGLLVIDGWNHRFYTAAVEPNPGCRCRTAAR
jgi:molybdopterin-synthase adenylyltransferase